MVRTPCGTQNEDEFVGVLRLRKHSASRIAGYAQDDILGEIYFAGDFRAARLAAAQPSLFVWRARPSARASTGTSSVIEIYDQVYCSIIMQYSIAKSLLLILYTWVWANRY